MREVIPIPVPGLDLRREYGHHQSPAIWAGGMFFCSGMVATDPQSGERQHGTVTSEARRIFENLKLLLESTGLSLDRLVQVHAMIYDRIEYDVLNRLGAENSLAPDPLYPCKRPSGGAVDGSTRRAGSLLCQRVLDPCRLCARADCCVRRRRGDHATCNHGSRRADCRRRYLDLQPLDHSCLYHHRRIAAYRTRVHDVRPGRRTDAVPVRAVDGAQKDHANWILLGAAVCLGRPVPERDDLRPGRAHQHFHRRRGCRGVRLGAVGHRGRRRRRMRRAGDLCARRTERSQGLWRRGRPPASPISKRR